jgi:cation:H+ antiporter
MVKRWEGILFVLLYTAYTLYLVLASVQHDAAEGFSTIMLWFVLPLVVMTLVAVTSFELGILKERKAAKLAKLS